MMGTVDRVWPMVGRDGALDEVASALRAPEAHGVVVAGPGGVGKTRLARESLALAEQAGFAVTALLATRAAASLPLGAFAPVLPVSAGPEVAALRTARDALLEMADDAPLVLLVDDAHLLDPISATLLQQLAHDTRVFTIATVRTGEPMPDAITALWKDAGSVRIDLDPLPPEAAEQLLRAVLGGPLSSASLQAIHERSAGNPLALRELVLGGLGEGSLREEGGIWHLAGAAPLSNRLTALIEARLGNLDPDELDALAWATLGEPVRLDVLERLAGEDLVARLDDRDLLEVVPGPDTDLVRLAHPLYGEVAVSSIGTLRRRRLLARLADAEEAVGVRTPTDLLRVATWRLGAGEPADPALLLDAADVAYARQDYRRAEELARAAWEVERSARAGHLLGFCLGREGRAEPAETLLAAAADLATDDRLTALIAMARSENRFRGLADLDGALAVNQAAEDAVVDDRWRDELRANRAMFVLMAGDPAGALDLVQPMLADGAPERPFVKAAYVAGPLLASDGRTAEALAVATRALPVHERVWAEDLFQTEPAVHHVSAILALTEAGDLHQAEGYADLALRTATAVGNPYAIGFMAMLSGLVALRRGRVRTAGDRCREAALAFETSGYLPQRRWVLAGAAHSAALTGSPEEAQRLLAQADDLAAHTAVRFNEGIVDEARGWVLLSAGRPTQARRVFAEAAGQAAEASQRALAAGLLHSLARAGDARSAVGPLCELADRADGSLTPLRRDHVVALVHQDGAALDEVSAGFETIGADLYAAEASADAARAHRAAGNPRAATRAAARSRALAERCEGAVTPALAGLGEVISLAALTPREREVATLAASGLASLEIADRLQISRRTVDNHLQRAYDKLGVTSRRDLATALGAASEDA